MERNQFWILVGLGLMCGVCLEIIKAPAHGEKVRLAGFTTFETLLDEGSPVYQPSEKVEKPRGHIEPEIVETQNEIVETLAEDPPPQPVTVAQNAPLDEAAAKKKAEDEKKKKADEDKKKKKKKKKKKEAAGEVPQDQTEESEEKPTDDEAAAPAEVAGAGPGAGPAAPQAINDGNPHTFEEWKAFLLAQPNFDRLSKFIREFQTGNMKAEVFYKVVDALLADPRIKMKEYGVIALAGTPSTRSFSGLVNVLHSESDDRVRGQADGYLKMYGQPKNLRFLANVIASNSKSATQMEAIRIIKSSAESYAQQPQVDPTSTEPRASHTGTMSRYYEPLVELLDQASRNGQTDGNVRAAAAETLASLQAILADSQQAQQQSQQTELPQPRS